MIRRCSRAGHHPKAVSTTHGRPSVSPNAILIAKGLWLDADLFEACEEMVLADLAKIVKTDKAMA